MGHALAPSAMLATKRRWAMFKPARVAATLPAQDMERAKAFYRDKLGLTPTQEDSGGGMYALAAGTRGWGLSRRGEACGAHRQPEFEVGDVAGRRQRPQARHVTV